MQERRQSRWLDNVSVVKLQLALRLLPELEEHLSSSEWSVADEEDIESSRDSSYCG